MAAPYSARQAATLCDISEATVRRAIASGRICPIQVDGAWQLTDEHLEELRQWRRRVDARHDARRRTHDAAASSHSDAGASPSQDDALHWARLVEQLHKENVELSGRVGWLMSELEQARATIRLLQAPAATHANGAGEATAETIHATTSEQPQRPPDASIRPAAVETPNHAGDHVITARRPPWWARFWRWGVA